MQEAKEITHELLKKSVGKKVEVVAFGIAYRGRLKKFDPKMGIIRIVDEKRNSAVLEIERIQDFSRLGR